MAARAHRFGWAAAWRLAGASPATRSLALLPPWALLACAVLLLAGAPPELCWWLTWRGCWCCDQGRRNLRPHLHLRRSRCAPLRSSRRPRRPAGPDQPRETVFGFCCCAAARLAVAGAAESSGSVPIARLAYRVVTTAALLCCRWTKSSVAICARWRAFRAEMGGAGGRRAAF